MTALSMPQNQLRLMAEVEREANVHWTFTTIAWAAQLRGDTAGALKSCLAMHIAFDEVSARIYSGAYLKGRRPGIHTRRKGIDDTAAHEFMIARSAETGEMHGETLAKAALAAGLGRGHGGTPTANKKRLAGWWRTFKANK